MGLQVKVKFDGVHDIAVHDGARSTIPTAISFLIIGGIHGEESDVVSLPDDDNGDLRVDLLPLASPYASRYVSNKLSA